MALLPLLLVLALVVAVPAGVAAARRTPPSRDEAVAAARRHAVRIAAVALLAAALAGLGTAVPGSDVVSGPGSLGRTLLLAPWQPASRTPSSCCSVS